jgi:hypothetical protein
MGNAVNVGNEGASGNWERFGVSAYRRIGVWACGRVGVSAYRRIGVWAYRRVGVSACRRIGVSAYRRVGVPACGRTGVWACGRVARDTAAKPRPALELGFMANC